MFEILKQYQIISTGLLGFIGVIATIAANGYWARKQRISEIENRAKSIRSALKAELEINKSTFEARVESLESSTSPNSRVPIRTYLDVYHSALSDIGILGSKEVKSIVNAYLLIEELPTYMEFHANDRDGKALVIPQKNRRAVADLHSGRLAAIDKAITTLSDQDA
ncbi:hypothetical protein [Microbulbifer hainanensis]|uniref:hypothetical protein n=1 Tax=Microbulbifer hainanensis TaxID=2735675 RepID=UPI001868D16F|nr:hypothetical protein [Microbulbifer hainanensis]